MRILILTDSVALPREEPEECLYKDTFPILLKKNNNNIVHQVSIGGATSTELLNQVHYHLSFKPDAIIIQVGIVDCVPRFASKAELHILRKIPILGKFGIRMLNKKWVRKSRKITYVSPERFRRNLIKFKEIGTDRFCEIYLLGIIPATDDYEKTVPGITKRINQYNQIASNIFGTNFIDVNNFPSSGIMSDNHHINSIGHKFIKDILNDLLS